MTNSYILWLKNTKKCPKNWRCIAFSLFGRHSHFTESVNTSDAGDLAALALNSFRYRGYVYDFETGFYYLQSRYYDPETGRFISADNADVVLASGMALTDKNLFAYCDNDPVNRTDETGEFWNLIIGGYYGVKQYAYDQIKNLFW